jgi:hypothetical protein
MNDIHDGSPHDHGRLHAHAAPTTQQIRTVGQRRREAEEKLEHHLDEARHKSEAHHVPAPEPETPPAGEGELDAGNIAAIQNDDGLTAADRVDLIANQVVPERDGKDG